MSTFDHLFNPIEVGPMSLRNRIYVTPHATFFASDNRDNLPGETIAHYCADRAKGGVGFIEVSLADCDPYARPISESHFNPLNSGHPLINGTTGRWPLRGNDQRVIDGYSEIARAVHAHGAKCGLELGSGGSTNGAELGVSAFPWASITNISPLFPFTGKEMTENEIRDVVETYGIAAKYAKEGGFDAVDLLADQGALLSEFLSKKINRRKDRYGGSIDNRMRLLLEVISRIRDYVRTDVAVGVRLMGDEKFVGANTPEDAREIAKRLDGRVDWITSATGIYPQHEDWQSVPMYVESGYNLRISSPIKEVLRQTKSGAVGRYVDPAFADRLIAEGRADMVAMTRALIADPELPNKARDGRVMEIRPCIGSLQDCWGRMDRGLPISCTVNPTVSREKIWGIGTLGKAAIKKRVLIIGAGPAGLETARIAAERGHSVVIYEKSKSPGGQALLAAKLPGRADIKSILNWQTSQLTRLGVETKFGMDVTFDPEVLDFVLSEEKPDVVVIATGSSSIKTGFQPYTFNEIEGWDEPVVSTDIDVLEQSVKIGTHVVIADTLSFIEAPGIAELLARQGKKVEVITFHATIGLELKVYNHWHHLFPRVFASGVKIMPFTWIKKIQGNSVTTYNVYYPSDERVIENIDNVILITGKMQNRSLYEGFLGKVRELYLVGDANIGGARIGNSFYDGQRVGRTI